MDSFYFLTFLLSIIISQAISLSLLNLSESFARFKRQFEFQDGEDDNVQVDDIEPDTDGIDFNGAIENFDDQPQQGGFIDQGGSNEEGQFEQPRGQGFSQNQQQGFEDNLRGFQQAQSQGSQERGSTQNQQQGFDDVFGDVQQSQNQGNRGRDSTQNQQQGFDDDFGGVQQGQNQRGQGQPQEGRGQGQRNPPTSSAAPRPTGATTPRLQFARCIRNCPVTAQYNPVCGTDSVTYSNEGRLNCARNCGTNVRVAAVGRC